MSPAPRNSPIDLRLNYPLLENQAAVFEDSLRALAASEFDAALHLPPAEGAETLRHAAADWLSRPEHPIAFDQVMVAIGGHHALLVALLAGKLSGSAIAVDPLTYPGLISVARLLGIRVIPCPGDRDGMLPDALRAACTKGAKAVYLMPTIHNPLGTVIPLPRRAALIAVAREQGLHVIEDDAYGFLDAGAPPSFAHLAPEISFYIYSLSKPIAPGIRTGFLCLPRPFFDAATEALRVSTGGGVPLNGTLVARWLRDGTLASWIHAKQQAAQQRHAAARQILAGISAHGHPTSYHLWLTLPDPVPADSVVANLAAQNISVSPGRAFTAPDSSPPNAIRVSLGGEQNFDRVATGLSAVAACIHDHARGELYLINPRS